MKLSLPLSWFLWSSYVLRDASSKLVHYVLNLLLKYPSVWFHSPYAKYLLSLVTCEKSCFEVCYTGRDLQRNAIVNVTTEELEVQRVWRVWRQGKAVLCFSSLLAPSVSSTAKTGVWKEVYQDDKVVCCQIIKVEGPI